VCHTPVAPYKSSPACVTTPRQIAPTTLGGVNVHANPLATLENVVGEPTHSDVDAEQNTMGRTLSELLQKTKRADPIEMEDAKASSPGLDRQGVSELPSTGVDGKGLGKGCKGSKGVKGSKGGKGGKGSKGNKTSQGAQTRVQFKVQTNRNAGHRKQVESNAATSAPVSLQRISDGALQQQKKLLKPATPKGHTGKVTRAAMNTSEEKGKENSAPCSPARAEDSLLVALQKKFKARNKRDSSERRLSMDWENSGDEA